LKPRHTLHLGEWGHWDFERPGGQCVDSHGLSIHSGVGNVGHDGLDETHDKGFLALECNGVAVLGALVVIHTFDLLAQTD